MHLTTLLQNLLRNNQFASGGLLMVMLGGVLAYLKSAPKWCYNKLLHQTTMSITIMDASPAFSWLKRWFAVQKFMFRVRRLDVGTLPGEIPLYTPAEGSHWAWYKGRLLQIHLTRAEQAKDSYTSKRSETFVITTWGRNPKFLQQLVEDIRGVYREQNKAKPTLNVWCEGGWTEVPGYTPRPLSSVFTPFGVKERLVRDVQRFKDSEGWYTKVGVPYHRGYLLHGPPGTGKTSLVVALSAHFNARVYVIRLNDMRDQGLLDAMEQVPEHAMVVFEDVDCVLKEHRETESGEKDEEDKKGIVGVSLAAMLNTLDGIHTPHGVMFFLTTNHMEKLDHALLRPGRVDYKLHLGAATLEQKLEMFKQFFPQESETAALQCVHQHPSETMAEWQGVLLVRREGAIQQEEQAGNGAALAAVAGAEA